MQIFLGNPLYQDTKRHLNNRSTVKNNEKMKEKRLLLFWFRFYSLFGVWKIVGILCVRVKINKRSFEPFCVWILF